MKLPNHVWLWNSLDFTCVNRMRNSICLIDYYPQLHCVLLIFQLIMLLGRYAPCDPQTCSFSSFLCVKGMYWLCEIPVASCEWCMKWKVFTQGTVGRQKVLCSHCWAEFLTVCWNQTSCSHPILLQNPRSSWPNGKRYSPTERQRDEFVDLQKSFLALCFCTHYR